MKPETQHLVRTVGDTDRITVVLSVNDGGTVTTVADGATVMLDVAGVSVEATALGDGSGTFYFSGALLSLVPAGAYSYDVTVDDGTFVYTILCGTMTFREAAT